jgi:hypothetical protein
LYALRTRSKTSTFSRDIAPTSISQKLSPSELVHITQVKPLEEQWVRLWFTDGAIKAEWPGEIDLDPVVLYGKFEPASGVRLERRAVQEPAAA